MNKFVKNPNLPESKTDTVIIGNHNKVIEELNNIGIKTVVLADNTDIDHSVRKHADMSACYLGEGRIILDKRQTEAYEKLQNLGMTVFYNESEIKGEYPNDVPLNCAIFGENLLFYPKGTATKILEENRNKRQISVKQGYCKCSVCPISESAIITDDAGIYNKTKDFFDVLLIEKGDILLEGKEYGFIGGASGMIDADTLLFFGNIDTHRNSDKIKAFLTAHRIKYQNLFDGNLIDIGGIIPITIK